MGREKLDRWCELGIVGLVLAILVFGPLATGAVRGQDFLVIQALTVGVLLLWALRFWLNKTYRVLWPPACWGVGIFLIYAIARYQYADLEYVARQELMRVLIYAVLFLAIVNNLSRQESTQLVTLTLIFLGMLISLYAIYQYLTRSEYVWTFLRPRIYAGRASGTYICPNHLAGFLEMLIPLGLACVVTGRFKPVTKVMLGYASLAMLLGLGVTISRAGWAATAVALLAMFALLLRHRDYRLPSLVLLVVLVASGFFFIQKSFSAQRRIEKTFVLGQDETRFLILSAASKMWRDHFWWGVGPAHFDYRFHEYRPARDTAQMRPDRVHNDYLNTLADWGMVGALLVLLAWILFYGSVLKSWRFLQRGTGDLGGKRSNRFAFVLGASFGLLAILLHSFSDFNMHIPANAILAVTLMALTASHGRFATDSYWVSLKVPGKILGTLVLLATVIYFGGQGWRRYREHQALQQAERFRQNQDKRIAALQNAILIEPMNFETCYTMGEIFRAQSWQGRDGYQRLAQRAIKWYQRSRALNPFDSLSFLREGMCLDWIGEPDQAEPLFRQAVKLDPNGYYTLALMGWHFVQLEDYQEAQKWFVQSQRSNFKSNPITDSYLEIIQRKLAEQPVIRREK